MIEVAQDERVKNWTVDMIGLFSASSASSVRGESKGVARSLIYIPSSYNHPPSEVWSKNSSEDLGIIAVCLPVQAFPHGPLSFYVDDLWIYS